MNPIKLTAYVDEKRRITIDLPDDVPVGQVEITVQPLLAKTNDAELTREEARARLIAAGLVSPVEEDDPDAMDISEEELDRLGRLFADDNQPFSEIINEDREDRV